MAVKLRLRRMGRKKWPIYAVVAADARAPRDGRFIEDLGRYRPIADPATVVLKEDRIMHWLSQGAQPTDTVRDLLSKEGIMLRRHLEKGGKNEEEVAKIVADWKAERAEATEGSASTSASSRRAEALAAERASADANDKAAAKARAEAEAKAEAEAEEAKRKLAEEAAAKKAEAVEAAQAEQAEANEVTSEAEVVEAAPEATTEVAEAAPEAKTEDKTEE